MGIDLSNSRLSALQMCGEYFRRKYVDSEWRPGTLRMHRGSVVHEVSAVAHKRQFEAKQNISGVPLNELLSASLPSEDEAADLAATAFDRIVTTDGVTITKEDVAEAGGSEKRAIGMAKDSAIDMSAFYVGSVAPNVNPIAFERKITIKPKDSDVTIRSILDLVEEEPDGGELIPDLKTSSRTPPKDAAEKDQQLSFYAMARQAETGKLPDAESLRFVVSTQSKGIALVERRTVVTQGDVDSVVARINAAVRAIQAGIFIPAAPGHWKCSQKWCEFWASCPYALKRGKE